MTSESIQELPAGTPLHVTQNGTTTIYYPKSQGGWTDDSNIKY